MTAGPLVRLAMWFMNRRVYSKAANAKASYYRFMTKSDGAQLQRVAHWMERGTIRPVIDRCFKLEQAVEALQYLELGRARGKVVLEVRSRGD